VARDVEYDVIANDKTDAGLASAERRFKKTSDNVKRESDKMSGTIGKSLVSAVETFSPRLAASITRGVASAGEAAGPLLVGGIAAAAPIVGATLSAALLAGAGIGAAGIGVAIVSQDARVQAAAKHLGDGIKAQLTDSASGFVQPVLKGIETIQASFTRMDGTFDRIFANASKFVDPLVRGATQGFEGILHGVDALVANAGPVIDALSNGFERLGEDVGDMFETIAGGSEGAADGVDSLFDALSDITEVVGPVVRGLTEIKAAQTNLIDNDTTGALRFLATQLAGPLPQLASLFEKTGEAARKTGSGTFGAAEGVKEVTAAAGASVFSLQAMSEALDRATEQNRSLYDSTTSVGEALHRVSEAAKENGKTLSSHSEKGRANRQVLSSLATALNRQYDAYVEVNGAGAAADRVAASNRASFIKAAIGFGASASAAKNLANQILGIPAKKTSKIDANTANASAKVSALRKQLDGVHDKTVTIAMRITGNQNVSSAQAALRKNFDATNSFAFAGGGGTSRTGAPTPVNLNNLVENRIYLDSSLIDARTSTAIRQDRKRAQHWAKVGKRQ
jgi:hypothetical protein